MVIEGLVCKQTEARELWRLGLYTVNHVEEWWRQEFPPRTRPRQVSFSSEQPKVHEYESYDWNEVFDSWHDSLTGDSDYDFSDSEDLCCPTTPRAKPSGVRSLHLHDFVAATPRHGSREDEPFASFAASRRTPRPKSSDQEESNFKEFRPRPLPTPEITFSG